MDEASWWYEWEGRQAGPVDEAALLELVRSGRLGGAARVWRSGMSGWQPLREVPGLAGALPPPIDAPPIDPPAGAPPLDPSAQAAALPDGMEATSTGAVLALGVLTLGIYPAVKFYRAGVAYAALAGRASRFTTWFWLSIALGLAGGPLHLLGGVPGVVTHIAAIAFTVLTLLEFLALRAELMARHRVAPALTSATTHQALFIAGILTAWLAVGFVLLAVEAVKLFQDHRALGDALRARAATTPPGAGRALG